MLRMEIALFLVLGFVAYMYDSAERTRTALHRTFSALLAATLVHLVFDALTPQELGEVEKLKAEKYDTWEWNYGRSPKFDVRCKRYWDGGCLEANVSIANGVITDVRFFGDFLSVCGLEELVERLKGVAFRPEDVRAVLNDSPVGELFGGITADEVTATIFDL
mgnify:CR=1 FL=1